MSHSIPLISSTRSTPSAGGPIVRVAGFIAGMIASAVREWRVQHAMRQVEALDDRVLADIGIGHGQAESAVRHGRSGLRVRAERPAANDVAFTMGPGWTDWR